jgi:hypothetical protein
MACIGCKKILSNEKREKRKKLRELARKIAELDGKNQVIIENGGQLSIECESCWEKGGRIGRVIEYIIV